MEKEPQNVSQILSRNISGFHQYCLDGTPCLTYVSRNLCSMLALTREELLEGKGDGYLEQVHPADRQRYGNFLKKLSEKEQTGTIRYRLLKRGGSILHVSDTLVSYRWDGRMLGDSVLTDITDLKMENQNLRFLSETMPWGFLTYTCEPQPRVTYINDWMLKFLHIPENPEGEFDVLELYRQNIYLMIPMEERQRFSGYLDGVYRSGAPIAGEMTVLRCDGTKGRLFGWVAKCVNAQGTEEFQSMCMDITQQHRNRKEKETGRYLRALTGVYDKIFEYDLSRGTVTCLYGQNSPTFRWVENIPMQMEEATEKWILSTVQEEDRAQVRQFFADFIRQKFAQVEKPPVIRYRALSSGGMLKTYTGLFITMDSSVSLFCCKNVPESEEESLRSENTSLKSMNENMQKLVMQFTDGIAAFEVVGDVVTPLYASDNVCDFFGFSREEWLSVMKKRTPIQSFVSRSRASYRDFAELLERGESEFTYVDLGSGRNRCIKAICSPKMPEGSGSRYVMLYNLEDGVRGGQEHAHVRIRTFGYFDVFVDGRPIAFRNEKSKELFALLTDRRGGFVTSEEAISFLWEEEPANAVTLARYRKVALRLKNILEEYGISHIVESVNGKRRLVTDSVTCDLYDYLSGKEEYRCLFKGSYLSNYSWGENTLAELTGAHLYGTGGEREMQI